MILFKKPADIHEQLVKLKAEGRIISFVPTMGALHAGHISLLKAAEKDNAMSVCSIFVNPTQFNDAKDFTNYPITVEKDIDALERAGCGMVFMPTVADMYPGGTGAVPNYDLGYLETVLEGKYRPGHFQGVCQVVHRLLQVIPADELYLGQKDYQQCMVIRKMTEITGIRTNIIICPTLREAGGLAMSSRNMRLNEGQRKQALMIYKTLQFLNRHLKPGNLADIKQQAVGMLNDTGFKVDYVEIADAGTLEILDNWNGQTKPVALAAAFLGEVRLIDNMLLDG
jgi:pantoate--beta-alanine ligase